MFLNFCVKGINQTEMDPPSKPIQWACATVGVAEEEIKVTVGELRISH
jgi:hypothetical protein